MASLGNCFATNFELSSFALRYVHLYLKVAPIPECSPLVPPTEPSSTNFGVQNATYSGRAADAHYLYDERL